MKQNLKYRLIPPANRVRQAIESILPSSVQISERYTLPWCIPPLLRSVYPLLLRLWLVNQWTISPSLSPWSRDYCNKWFSLSEFLSLSLFLFSLFPRVLSFFFPVYSWLFFFTSSCGWGRMSRDILSPGRSRRQWLTTKGAEEAGLHKTIFFSCYKYGKVRGYFFILFSLHCPFLTLFAFLYIFSCLSSYFFSYVLLKVELMVERISFRFFFFFIIFVKAWVLLDKK